MVDENIIRKDLSFAEMAMTAHAYAADPATPISDVDSAVAEPFHSAGYQRRSYIRNFAHLLDLIGPCICFPHEIPRNLGLALLQEIKRDDTLVRRLRAHLIDYNSRSVMVELKILQSFADGTAADPDRLKPRQLARPARRTFQIGQVRCIAGQGRLALKLDRDFTVIDRLKLTQGITRLLASLD
ncbi:MAG: hypothetical protein IKD58_10545 [Loktanella sp.]|nr:hypothetical protein [Loktanella sp.]